MRRKKTALLALTALAWSASADAAVQDPSASLMSPTFNRCMEDAEGVMGRMLQCLAAETDRQEEMLNRNYQAALANDPAHASALRVRERAWLKRREVKCRLDREGGSAAIAEASDCNLTETALKAEQLRKLASRP